MIIERVNNEIIIRLSGDINIDELQDMTDWFQYKELTRNSKAKQEDVDALVNQVKKDNLFNLLPVTIYVSVLSTKSMVLSVNSDKLYK